MKEIVINEKISYIECSEDPLSADIGIIRDGDAVWLYDVGSDEQAITELTDNYNVVLSHFHQDHTGNLGKLTIKEAFVSDETKRHVQMGTVADRDIYIDNLHIFPLPSSHCKGCLGLEVDETYAFVGDALYSKVRDGYYIFNAQLVKDEIAVLQNLKAPYLLVSHFKGLVRRRDEVIAELTELYQYRDKNSSEIKVKRG
ncbi:MAG: hypothetical protein ACI3XG_00130 [Faecousia sp.]